MAEECFPRRCPLAFHLDGVTPCRYEAPSESAYRRHLITKHHMLLRLRRDSFGRLLDEQFVPMPPAEAQRRHSMLSCRQAGRTELRDRRRRYYGPRSGGSTQSPMESRGVGGAEQHSPCRRRGGPRRESPELPSRSPCVFRITERTPISPLLSEDSDDGWLNQFLGFDDNSRGVGNLAALPPPPVYYRHLASTVDAATNTDEPALVRRGMTMPPTSAEALGRLVGSVMIRQPLSTSARVADESLRQLQGFRHLEESEVATIIRATDFAHHLTSFMATEVLRNLSPRVGYVPVADLFQELVNSIGQWATRPTD